MGKMVLAFLLLWLFTPFDASGGATPGEGGGWIDLMFVIDGSESVGKKNFETLKRWIIEVATGFDIAKQVQLGVVQFSHWFPTLGREQRYIKTEVGLGAYRDQEALAKAVRTITYMGYTTYTAHAIEKTVREDFNGSGSRYPTARRVMVLVTDGNSTDHDMLPSAVSLANRAGVTSFAVAVGNFNLEELHLIAGSKDRIIKANNFDKLLQSVPKMQHLIKGSEENSTHLAESSTVEVVGVFHPSTAHPSRGRSTSGTVLPGTEKNPTYLAESATVEVVGVFHPSITHPSMQGRSTSGTVLPDVMSSNLSSSTIITLVSVIVLLLAVISGIAGVFLYKRLKKSPSRNNQNPQTQEFPLQRVDEWNSQSRRPGERFGQAVLPGLPEDPHIYEEMKYSRHQPEPPLPGLIETPGNEAAKNNSVLPDGEYAECRDPTTSQQSRIRNQNSAMLKQGST